MLNYLSPPFYAFHGTLLREVNLRNRITNSSHVSEKKWFFFSITVYTMSNYVSSLLIFSWIWSSAQAQEAQSEGRDRPPSPPPFLSRPQRKGGKQRTAVLTITHQDNENQDKKEQRMMQQVPPVRPPSHHSFPNTQHHRAQNFTVLFFLQTHAGTMSGNVCGCSRQL